MDDPSTVLSFSDNGGRSSDNAARKWTLRTEIHRLRRLLITRWQPVNEPQAKPTSVLDLRRADAQTVGQLEAFELVRTTETQWARGEKQSVIQRHGPTEDLLDVPEVRHAWALVTRVDG